MRRPAALDQATAHRPRAHWKPDRRPTGWSQGQEEKKDAEGHVPAHVCAHCCDPTCHAPHWAIKVRLDRTPAYVCDADHSATVTQHNWLQIRRGRPLTLVTPLQPHTCTYKQIRHKATVSNTPVCKQSWPWPRQSTLLHVSALQLAERICTPRVRMADTHLAACPELAMLLPRQLSSWDAGAHGAALHAANPACEAAISWRAAGVQPATSRWLTGARSSRRLHKGPAPKAP